MPEKLKILQIAPIAIPLTPTLRYGGIERVVLALGRSFQSKGHEVITASPADSSFLESQYGRLLPTIPQSQWIGGSSGNIDPRAYEAHVNSAINYIVKEEGVDIVHDHTGNFVLSDSFRERGEMLPKLRDTPVVVTPHEFARFRRDVVPSSRNIFFTTLSEFQKGVFSPYVDVKRVINNGVFVDEYPFVVDKEDYAFSLGSIEHDKGQDIAIRVAEAAKLPLVIGGNIAERGFFDATIKPHLNTSNVRYIGELDDVEKKGYYSKARVFLAPIRIGDCFTLTRIEALACGTPVVTLDTGSAREAVTHGRTGFVINDDSDKDRNMVDAIKRIDEINLGVCRKEAEERFSWQAISDKYIGLYEEILSGRM